MSTGELLATVLPSMAGGAGLIALQQLLRSREKQGERMGRTEKWIDVEEGRRKGYAEGYAAGRDSRAGDRP